MSYLVEINAKVLAKDKDKCLTSRNKLRQGKLQVENSNLSKISVHVSLYPIWCPIRCPKKYVRWCPGDVRYCPVEYPKCPGRAAGLSLARPARACALRWAYAVRRTVDPWEPADRFDQ